MDENLFVSFNANIRENPPLIRAFCRTKKIIIIIKIALHLKWDRQGNGKLPASLWAGVKSFKPPLVL